MTSPLNQSLLESYIQSTEASSTQEKCSHCQGHAKGTLCPLHLLSQNQAHKMAESAKEAGSDFVTKAKKLLAEQEDGKNGEKG